MLLADRIIACFLIFLSLYFTWYASELPIGWNGMTGGPGGGAFGFWLSVIMLLASVGILRRSYQSKSESEGSFFDPEMLRSVLIVTLALVITVALLPWLGAYIALPFFTLWYLRFFGGHGWGLSLFMSIATAVFFFFFFEVTLRILLPKGITEPVFIPLYAQFF